MRILFLGDGQWAGRSLLRLREEGHTLVGAVIRSRPTDDSLSDAAAEGGVPVLQPADPADARFLGEVKAAAPELAISVAYDRILRRPFLTLPTLGCVNLHAGQLPRYRGRNVVNWAIINGESEIGLTAHRMDEGIDTGDILLQRLLPIGWTDTYGDVLARLTDAMPDVVTDTVRGIADGTLVPMAQPAGSGTYYGGRVDGDEWLDWEDTSRNLYNKIRGITRPGPGARTVLGERPVIVWRAEYDPAWPSYRATPGEVVGRCASGASVIKTGDSTLVLREVQVGAGEAGAPAWRLGTRLGINAGAALSSLLRRHP